MTYLFLLIIMLLEFYAIILSIFLYLLYKPDFLNIFFSFGVMLFTFFHIVLFLFFMSLDLTLNEVLLPLWMLALVSPIILVIILIIISTLLVYFYHNVLGKDFSNFLDRLELKANQLSKIKQDTHRKINHIIIFIGLLIVWFIGVYIANFITGTNEGMIPEENNILLVYFKIITKPVLIKEILFSFGWFYYLLFFFFYIFFLFILANEFTRKSKIFSFPFNLFPRLYLNDEEKRSYGTYLYFAIGHMFAAFICPPMVLFSILGISSIADLMTSQIGIRFGKRHINWNKNKTWEGTTAGVIVAFVISFIFIGIIWALIFAVTFLIFDIITNKPLKVSDNLLIPVGTALIYVLIRFIFNLNYQIIFFEWI